MTELIKSISLALMAFIIVLLILILLIRLLENTLTFHPVKSLDAYPQEYGLDHREVNLIPAEGAWIHGWYFPPREKGAPVLLICHGNAGNISHRLELAAGFARRGLGTLLFDYRGYGLSGGQPGEGAFREDVLAAWDYLVREAQIEPGRIISFGRSLGGAPASFLASRRQAGALVLEGAFPRGRDMARRIFGFLPVDLAMRNRWEVAAHVLEAGCPVMIIHGTADPVVPFSLGEKLRREVSSRNPEWWPVDGGGHLDLHLVAGESYYDRIAGFAARATVGQPRI